MLQKSTNDPPIPFPFPALVVQTEEVGRLSFIGEGSIPDIETLSDDQVKELLDSLIGNAGADNSENAYHKRYLCDHTGKRIYATKNVAYRAKERLNRTQVYVHEDPYKCKYCGYFHLSTIKRRKRFNVDKGIWDADNARSCVPRNRQPLMLLERDRGQGYYARDKAVSDIKVMRMQGLAAIGRFKEGKTAVQNQIEQDAIVAAARARKAAARARKEERRKAYLARMALEQANAKKKEDLRQKTT